VAPRRRAVLAAVTAGLLFAGGCGRAAPPGTSPQDRAVQLATTGCGYAADRSGSGVAVGEGIVVTTAHLVIQADHMSIRGGDGSQNDATVVGIDLERDLAAIRLGTGHLPSVETAQARAGTGGEVVGGGVSGSVPFEVNRVVEVSIEEVLGTERHKRLGYELDALTSRGDSGAGAYDDSDRLIGIVFAYSEDPQVTWVTASSEILDFLDAVDTTHAAWRCDEERSRLVHGR